jgi:hypothetical protein
MTEADMLQRMPAEELSARVALEQIRFDEREKAKERAARIRGR